MRLSLALACVLLLAGCAGPHSTGALWAQQNLEQELVVGRQPEAERVGKLRAYELALADESLTAERGRIDLALQDCPGAARKPLELSAGDRLRDTIRLRIGDDATRQADLALVALSDWRLRRAQATAETHFCAEARQALASSIGGDARAADSLTGAVSGQPNAADLLAGIGSATVTRARPPTLGAADWTTLSTDSSSSADGAAATLPMVSHYALGYVDTVRARAPLPQYLAAVYGGVLLDVESPPSLNIWVPGPSENPFTAESAVDLLAPVYPQWEPDAIYATLRPA
jgi:hypothetical protein